MGACEAAGVCEVVCVVLVAAAAALSATLSSGDKRTGAAVTTVRLIKRDHAPLHSYSDSLKPTITQTHTETHTHTPRLTHSAYGCMLG